VVDLQSRSFRDIGAELRAEFAQVVGKERGFMAGAGDGDVAEAGVEQVRVDAGIGVDQDTLGGEALRTVAGDGVAVIEMAVLCGVELDLAVIVETGRNATVRRDGLHGGKIAVGNAERLVGRSELDAVANAKFAVNLAVDADASQSTRIIGRLFAGGFFDSELVGSGVDADNSTVAPGLHANGLAATGMRRPPSWGN